MSGSLNRKLGHAAPSTLAQSISRKEQDDVGTAGSWASARHCGQSTSPTGQPKPGIRRRSAVLGRAMAGLPGLSRYQLSQHLIS